MVIVIKLGSNVLHSETGIDENVVKNVVDNVCKYMKLGHKFIIVSSGAVAQGKKYLKINSKTKLKDTELEQVYASIGQVQLINTYQKYFDKYKIRIAQALLTRKDFSDREGYSSMKAVFEHLINEGIVPVVNENDVVCPDELDFSDNDQLSAYVAAMINADKLIILSNVDGLYNKHPDEGGELVKNICIINSTVKSYVSDKKSTYGRGGMSSKLQTAKFMQDLIY